MATTAMNSVTSTVEFQIDVIELRAIAWVDVNLTGKELNAIQVNFFFSAKPTYFKIITFSSLFCNNTIKRLAL